MASKTTAQDRRTTMMPVTAMDEIPVLCEQERTELTTSLKEAEARNRSDPERLDLPE